MPNPSGANQFANQPAYGDVKKLQSLQKAAPLAGAPTTSIGAPKRAQRRATKSQRSAPVTSAMSQTVGAATPVDYNAQLREIWNQLVQMQPDNPLFQYYAAKT